MNEKPGTTNGFIHPWVRSCTNFKGALTIFVTRRVDEFERGMYLAKQIFLRERSLFMAGGGQCKSENLVH